MLGFFKGDDFNGGNIAPVDGKHSNLDANSVHSKSAQNAITPDSPGSWKSYRAVPVVEEARAFTEEEADALTELEKDTRRKRKASKKAYDKLQKIGNHQTAINRHHETYRRNEGRNERRIQGYKSTSAKYLHSLRPEYAQLGQSLQKAEQLADQAINSLMSQL
ncbi:hypothetical protein [Planktothrix pseudagardhii]|uniref:Uncharacterized protein n=1 Tax=Planktothrix pseudagardhii TaxID=132604 RepID=A0A9W4CV42_9CYAN|nr:hypothetical protein [Planktothrix pseudagardhii]CAD5977087.1 hypothetical protein NO713_04263 [Planktothrix pseudagardhii]